MNSIMNTPIEKFLEDIDALRRTIHDRGTTLSAVERDLLLQRIRTLYETVLNGETGNSAHSSQEKIAAEVSSVELPTGEKISHPLRQAHEDEISLLDHLGHRFSHETVDLVDW